MNFTPVSNPDETNYTWKYNDDNMISENVQLKEAVITFTDVVRVDTGIYSLTAENAVGENEISFHLNVQCKLLTLRLLYSVSYLLLDYCTVQVTYS